MNKYSLKSLKAIGSVRGVYFSLGTTPTTDPKFDCEKAIINLFNLSKKTVHIAIYSLTNPEIVNAIIGAHERGIDIRMVVDASESRSSSQSIMINKISAAGIDIRLAVRQHALMHNKVGIFDNFTICTGSFNWTINAEKKNDENLIIIDGKEIAADYEKYIFQRILQNETLIKINEIDEFYKSESEI